jgi:hypothetical protein
MSAPNERTLLSAFRSRPVDWSFVSQRASSNPVEILLQDDDGMNVLHWATGMEASYRTLYVLFQQNKKMAKQAACVKDEFGNTPIRYACDAYKTRDTFQNLAMIAWAVPEALGIPSENSGLPIEQICCNAREDPEFSRLAIALLLQLHKPTSIFWPLDNIRSAYNEDIYAWDNQTRKDSNRGPLVKGNEILKTFWCLVCDAIEIYTKDLKNVTLLHRICSIPSIPWWTIRYAVEENPLSILYIDENGNTPLHVGVTMLPEFEPIEDLVLKSPVSRQALQIRNKKDQTPFMLATQNRPDWTSLHHLLLQLDPSAVESCGLDDALYPFVLARVHDISILYDMLREKPTLMMKQPS